MKENWLRALPVLLLPAMLVGALALAPTVSLRAQSELVTATPTSTRIFYVANEISFPQSDAVVWGSVLIQGTALTENFRQYQLHLSPTGAENWQWLYSSLQVVREGVLYSWDTARFADGFYDLRLRAVRDDGQYEQFFVRRVEVRNGAPPTFTPVLDPAGTPVPVTATATITPTATPTPIPDFPVRIPGGQGFYGPEPGSRLRGAVPIVATVNGTLTAHYRRFDLFLSAAGRQDWEWIGSGTEQTWQDTILVLDTRGYPDGLYDLRLRVVYQDSNYDEYFLPDLTFVNRVAAAGPVAAWASSTPHPPGRPGSPSPIITAPAEGAVVGDGLDVRGTAVGVDFARWELHWSPAGQARWSYLFHSRLPVEAGLLARLDLRGVAPGRYDLRLRVVRQDGNYDEWIVVNLHRLATE